MLFSRKLKLSYSICVISRLHCVKAQVPLRGTRTRQRVRLYLWSARNCAPSLVMMRRNSVDPQGRITREASRRKQKNSCENSWEYKCPTTCWGQGRLMLMVMLLAVLMLLALPLLLVAATTLLLLVTTLVVAMEGLLLTLLFLLVAVTTFLLLMLLMLLMLLVLLVTVLVLLLLTVAHLKETCLPKAVAVEEEEDEGDQEEEEAMVDEVVGVVEVEVGVVDAMEGERDQEVVQRMGILLMTCLQVQRIHPFT